MDLDPSLTMLLIVGGALGFYVYKTATTTTATVDPPSYQQSAPGRSPPIADSSTVGLSQLMAKHPSGSSVTYQWNMAGLYPGTREKPYLAAY